MMGNSQRGHRLPALLIMLVALVVAISVILGVALYTGTARAATPTRATIEATQFKVGSVKTGQAFAVCPGTKRAVGGGVVQSGDSLSVWVLASGPLDGTGVTLNTNDGDRAKQWYAAVFNGSGVQRTFRVFAICSGTSTATIEATPLTVQNNQIGEAFAVCPNNRRALGGGVVQSGAANSSAYVAASGPLDGTGFTSQTVTGDVARQWYGAINNATAVQRTYKVFAICSGDSAAKIKATAFSVESGQTVEAFAKCASTKRALGGGVVQSGSAEGPIVRASGPLDGTGVTLNTSDGDRARQWYAATYNFSGVLQEFKVFAVCE